MSSEQRRCIRLKDTKLKTEDYKRQDKLTCVRRQIIHHRLTNQLKEKKVEFSRV